MSLLTLLFACASTSSPIEVPPPSVVEAYLQEVEAWHQARVERLTAADGWLTLIGLHWLEDGSASVGSGAGQDVRLASPRVPEHLGTIERRGSELWLSPEGSVQINDTERSERTLLATDATGKPDVVQVDSVRFYGISRGDRLGLRVKDSAADARTHFPGIERFAVDPRWRVIATLEPHPSPTTLAVPNVLGDENLLPTPGRLHFTIDGQALTLDPVAEPGDPELFIVFGDETNGVATYGGGRFLDAIVQEDGRTVLLDFNKSVNPPCAFTNFATCPLPTDENRLAVEVSAGERDFGAH